MTSHFQLDGYEKAVIDANTVWEQLKLALPSADPDYLHDQANRLSTLSQDEIDTFMQDAIENNKYPTMQDYLK